MKNAGKILLTFLIALAAAVAYDQIKTAVTKKTGA